ncbi:putative membrane protein [Owenweeksia hongkongensis DSM 17368]|uniref:Putative membrane protein n=2 Tax=Owenweeksia TaxID=267986 RepID=G8R2P1_OWEHD|nr:putative membrane protein [Owenweeksia hongkongensis DSM 17368]
MRINPKSIWEMLKATAKSWNDSDPFRQSAIIAYYAIFSIPGLLMIVIWVAGSLFGPEAIRGEISAQVSQFMGPEAATGIEDLLANVELNDSNFVMKTIGVLTLIFGATTLFFQLQKSLNYIWDVESSPENGIKKLILDRASSLGLILVIAFLLLITLVLSAIISILGNWIDNNFGDVLLYAVQLLNFVLSLGVVSLLFAVMFKFLPDVEISWKSVWVGSIVTAVLFSIGKTLLGLYFAHADPSSSFGAAGTIILVMIWVNYTCLILFFGAEFTQVHARKYNHKIRPSKHAKWRAEHILKNMEDKPEPIKD